MGLVRYPSYLVENSENLDNIVYDVPEDIDREIAGLKLASMRIQIDELTDEQREYLEGWEHGT